MTIVKAGHASELGPTRNFAVIKAETASAPSEVPGVIKNLKTRRRPINLRTRN
jgi:hypothetical protein